MLKFPNFFFAPSRMFRPLILNDSNEYYFARFVAIHSPDTPIRYSLVVTNLVSAWIEESEPRKLGPAFTAAKSDLVALFSKLFKESSSAQSIIKSDEGYYNTQKNNMNPKFHLSPRTETMEADSQQFFDTYDLTVKFIYHTFPITYVFHLEPIPSPQEFIRDNVINPLLFSVLQLSKNNESMGTSKTALNLQSREIIQSTSSPYETITGIGSQLLELYYRNRLDPCKVDEETQEPEESSVAKGIDLLDSKGPWKVPATKSNLAKDNLELCYDATTSSDIVNSLGLKESGTQSSGSGSSTLPHGMGSLEYEMALREEQAKAQAIEERLAKKKRKREEQDYMLKNNKIRKFL